MDIADQKPKAPPVPLPMPPPLPVADHIPSTLKSEHEPSCSSSDSDTDSDWDFFQIEASELVHLPPIPARDDPLIDDSHLVMNGSEKRLSEKYLDVRSEERQSQSPAVQVMERDEAIDPDRIPSSIFARSSPTPMEWSVASNDSLFSIYMDSTSFSKDQLFLTGRSGDLGGLSNVLDYSPPLPLPLSMSPLTTRENPRAAIVDLGKMEEAAASANAEAMIDVMKASVAEKERQREKPPSERLGHSLSRHSDGSTTSFRSFAFPILTGEGRNGLTKVDSVHNLDFHPLSQVTVRKAAVGAPAATATTATTATAPAPSQDPAPTSLESLWFSCFSCCKFCC